MKNKARKSTYPPPGNHPITAWRDKHGMTQAELIERAKKHMPKRAEISISKLSRIEGRATGRPDIQFLKALEKATGVPLSEMI